MCNALAALTEEEGRDLKNKVDALIRWKNKITGGVAVVAALLGIMLYLGNRMITKADELNASVTELTADLRVFRTEVAPFIQAGPRFTLNDYKQQIEVSKVQIMKDVRVLLDKEVPPTEVKVGLAKGEADHKHHSTLIESMERRIETLEKALHNGN